MESAPLEFFKRLLDTPSPSGYEKPVQDLVRSYLKPIADSVETDLHGNVIGAKNTSAPLRVMYAGHCDQIGMLVSQIDELGFIYAQTIGGWDPQQLIGQRMVIWTSTGPVPAVIARKPIHLLTDEERKTVVQTKDLWLDIGAKDQAEAKELVRIGDPVTLKLGFEEMRNGLANAPKMDNTTGLWVVLEALRRAGKLNCALYSVSTVQEEIGLRGAKTSAHGINPQVGIGVDVFHATDCPTIDKRQLGEITLGKGPVIFRGPNMNPKVVDLLVEAAESYKIPYQLAALGKPASNDSNALQMSQAGVAAGCVSIPNRYMHSAVEVISLEDLDNAATLLARFAEMIDADHDFRP
ncbi:M42 family metallopeptidase [Blastopirellula sp. JC732]|uniref:M42 family metallopeptidase n=1 Tax=Blastopirellula sediminis TaxID=2894196 RepID=A0A9X1MIV6_9BACT|nr:M42 family metallopeptidase [Blastopirellula sediminis]MCC9609555.1 M42 family metallopeptidase [Blastopirellula sediminis]MCC9627669.1 M42 family metallopeptidase [Blastopirellula sediminis]